MPTYDYRCTRCRRSLAVEQSILDKPLRKCKTCGGKLEKMLPKSVNLIFKGSGFYITDYRKGSGQAGESKDRHGSKSDGPEGKSKTSAKIKTPEKNGTSQKGG
jgi:putative FmdB family regulatory protein